MTRALAIMVHGQFQVSTILRGTWSEGAGPQRSQVEIPAVASFGWKVRLYLPLGLIPHLSPVLAGLESTQASH